MDDLTADQLAVLHWLEVSTRVAQMSPSEQAQVAYELQKRGLIRDAGCCGQRELTDAGRELLWRRVRPLPFATN